MATVSMICKLCKKEKIIPFKNRRQKYCSRNCVNKAQSGSGNPMFGKVAWSKKEKPEIAEMISINHKKNKVNVGDKNGMKKVEAREKASLSRKKMMKDPKIREEIAKKTKKAWEDGKFDGVSVGKCQWYSFERKNGEIAKVQGTWELAFIKWLEQKGMTYTVHKGRIPYIDKCGNSKNYYPDFFVDEWGCYVDVKNKYHLSLNEEKFNQIEKSNPEINVKILLRKDLENLGVVL